MVETRRSQRSAAAAGPGAGGGGSDGEGGDGGGKGGRGRGKRPASSASTTKRGKDEAPEQKETPAAPAAAGKSLGSREADKMGQWQPVLNPHPPPPSQRNRQRPWARLLSQHPEIAHYHIYADEIRIGRDDRCDMFLRNHAYRAILCMLRRLQQGGPCELEFTGQNGLVVLNEKRISPGDKVSLIGGDELIFGANDAYIFQHPLRDTEVTKAVQISAVNSADTELSRWITFKDQMKHRILDPNDIDVTLDNFPYYLSEITKKALLSPAFVHSKKFGITFPEILSLNPRILLSGPSGSETYQETLVKALAKDSEARLLIAGSLTLGSSSLKDVRMDDAPCTSGDIDGPSNLNTFREGDRVEYTGTAFKLKQSGPAYGSRGKVVLAFEKNQLSKLGVRFNNPITHGNDLGGLCEINNGFFCHAHELRPDSSAGEEVDSVALGKLIEVISEESKGRNLIVLLKDVQKLFIGCRESHASLIRELPPGVLIIGSHTQTDSRNDQETHSSEKMQETLGSGLHETDRSDLSDLFPNKITIELPQNEAQLSNLKKQLESDTETLKANANVHNIRKFLTSRKIECNDLQELSIKDQLLTNESVDKIVGLAISHHFQQNKPPSDGKIILPIKSLKHGFSMLQNTHSGRKSSNNILKDVVTENYFENTILKNVISPNETGVTFEDIGALDNVKETLRELVMLPLQRPELFSKGQLRKPVKGILLFGPPGTGKTMLAKAVATEAGANFINVSISSIMSKWLGESEKYVKAIFSLASKIAPAVIFVDEVDSLLAMRGSQQEHEAMRKVKNEFMVNWDGLRTKERERVLVLGTTNRPHDLDEAVIRRFSRRIMVDLPDAQNREKILKVILSKETLAPDVDLGSVANMTEGYSGSDLKNLCITAAHGPVREITEKEKKEKSLAIAEGKPEPPLYGGEDVRPLGMVDLKLALNQVGASLSTDSVTMSRIVQWNNEFGAGGSRRKEPPSYML